MGGILHTVNKSPYEKNSLRACLRLSQPGSSILLIEDGVYAAVAGGEFAAELASIMADRTVSVLGPDLAARGIAVDRIADGIRVVDYDGFVRLAVESDKVQSWL